MKRYREANKNDYVDGEAIAEAVTRKNLRFVPIKTEDQLDVQGLHRVRERLVHNRTEVINQIRGFLLERGITFNRGPRSLRKEMPDLLEDAEQNLTPQLRSLLAHLWQEWQGLDSQIDRIGAVIEEVAQSDAACQRLRSPSIARAIILGSNYADTCKNHDDPYKDLEAVTGMLSKLRKRFAREL